MICCTVVSSQTVSMENPCFSLHESTDCPRAVFSHTNWITLQCYVNKQTYTDFFYKRKQLLKLVNNYCFLTGGHATNGILPVCSSVLVKYRPRSHSAARREAEGCTWTEGGISPVPMNKQAVSRLLHGPLLKKQ